MAVLVGGLGYIGSQVAKDLLERGEHVIGIENCFSTDPVAVRRLVKDYGLDLVPGTVVSRQVLRQALRRDDIDRIYWLAAQASGHPEAAPARYTETTNLIGPRMMLDAAGEYGIETVVFASSLKVYGPYLSTDVDETTPYGQFTDLAHLSHCYVEKLLEMCASRHQLRCLAVRLGIVYGLGPVVKRDERFMTAPNKFCQQAVRGQPLTITPSGAQLQGFIHITDASRAMLSAPELAPSVGFTAVNAVTEITSPLAIAKAVQSAAAERGWSVPVIAPEVPPATGNIRVRSKLETLGFEPTQQIRSVLPAMLDFFARIEAQEVKS